jgi:hypothetical protein
VAEQPFCDLFTITVDAEIFSALRIRLINVYLCNQALRGYARLSDLHTIDDSLLVFSVFLVDGLLYISEGAER